MNASTASCPHCGAEIRADAKFCRYCGSSDSDGWRDEDDGDEMENDSLDDFDYDEFVSENFSTATTNKQTRPIWRLVAVVLLVLFALGFLLW